MLASSIYLCASSKDMVANLSPPVGFSDEDGPSCVAKYFTKASEASLSIPPSSGWEKIAYGSYLVSTFVPAIALALAMSAKSSPPRCPPVPSILSK